MGIIPKVHSLIGIAIILLGIGFSLNISATVGTSWLVPKTGKGIYTTLGLFKICGSDRCVSTETFLDKFGKDSSSALNAVKALCILGVIGSGLALIMTLTFLSVSCRRRYIFSKIVLVSGILSIVSGVFTITAISVFAGQENNNSGLGQLVQFMEYGSSFILCIVGAVLVLVGGVIILVVGPKIVSAAQATPPSATLDVCHHTTVVMQGQLFQQHNQQLQQQQWQQQLLQQYQLQSPQIHGASQVYANPLAAPPSYEPSITQPTRQDTKDAPPPYKSTS